MAYDKNFDRHVEEAAKAALKHESSARLDACTVRQLVVAREAREALRRYVELYEIIFPEIGESLPDLFKRVLAQSRTTNETALAELRFRMSLLTRDPVFEGGKI